MSSICTNVVKLWILLPLWRTGICCISLQTICIVLCFNDLWTGFGTEAHGDKDATPVTVLEQKYHQGASSDRSYAQFIFGLIRSYALTAS
jgi:hypothetical protein